MDSPDNVYRRDHYSELNNYGNVLVDEKEQNCYRREDEGDILKHIIMFSGGKDSTTMLLMMLEKNMKVDEIIFCDTGMEFPPMYKHIKKVEKYIDRKITRLKADHTFFYYFSAYNKIKGKTRAYYYAGYYKDNEPVKVYLKNIWDVPKGKQIFYGMDNFGYEWPDFRNRWCTTKLKKEVAKKYLKKYNNYVEYHGIAVDEKKRVKDDIKYPLVDWGVTEKQALKYCYSKGFTWDRLYKIFNRVSCYCCPLKSLQELENLYIYFPELWQEMIFMDRNSRRKFRPDYSLQELSEKFH